jgi:outer membrane protein OmpA-like peptidoglycan-associated protein
MKALTMTAGGVIACMMIAGCASAPPPELKNARTAYQDAAQAPGAPMAQTDVYEAKKWLDCAELSFNEDGDAPETRDLAYVASRKALIAKANANTALAMQQKQIAMQEAQRWKDQQALALREQLGRTKVQLEVQQKLDAEQQAKMKALGAKLEERGIVLTISGSVLFATGKSELMPTAAKRLDDVVAALKDDPRQLTVIGHTDSVGSDENNMTLSRKRAEAVRNYLITHGLPENRITAEGEGETRPIADNKTADGRANNRRVEVIVNLAPGARAPIPGSGQQPQQPMQPKP